MQEVTSELMISTRFKVVFVSFLITDMAQKFIERPLLAKNCLLNIVPLKQKGQPISCPL